MQGQVLPGAASPPAHSALGPGTLAPLSALLSEDGNHGAFLTGLPGGLEELTCC